MTYKNKSELIKILYKINHFAIKKLGQNFLINPEIIKIIIKAAELNNNELVVEVGPGLGVLTTALLENAQKVISVELDNVLFEYLKNEFIENKNLTLINQDALKYDPPETAYKLVANIPYYITSPLIQHFLNPKHGSKPQRIVLLTQKEVAEKICAKAKDHSVLSLQTQLFGKAKIISNVAASNFFPPPKVESSILMIEPHHEPLINDTEKFIKIIKIAFGQKRKMLAGTIHSALNTDRMSLENLLIKNNLNPKIRPQELEIADWKTIIEHQFK